MKLARLESTTASSVREVAGRPAPADSQVNRRVEAMSGIEGDRERSLQQEMAEIEARAIGDFDGAGQVLADAHDVAQALSRLGSNAAGLLKLQALSQQLTRVDDSA